MQLSDSDRDLLALLMVPGIGPRLPDSLLKRFGSGAGVARASVAALTEVPHLPVGVAELLQKSLSSRDVDAELERIAKHGLRLIPQNAPDYPAALGTIAVPPRFLYVRGTLE